MMAANFPALNFDRRQVALMVKIAAFFDPAFALDSLRIQQRRLMACGCMRPKQSLLGNFDLESCSSGYRWRPR
jgi:hypothetical protein